MKHEQDELAFTVAQFTAKYHLIDSDAQHKLVVDIRDAAQNLLRAMSEDRIASMKAQLDADKAELDRLRAYDRRSDYGDHCKEQRAIERAAAAGEA